jgi:VanZ family protein
MLRPLRKPAFWLAAFVLWAAVLWVLSSTQPSLPQAPPIPHLDKVAHFGYFFGGGGLLAAFFYLLDPASPRWGRIILRTVLVLALVGLTDEYHQTFTPGRSGNDPWDWLADVLGALAGSLVFKRLHRLLR